MKCPKCGKENENGARFCAMCGADLSQMESHTEAAEEQRPKKKKGKRIFAGIAGILVIAAIIGAGIWIINGKQTKKQYEHTLASGQKYLEELNYESAEDSYLKAIKIDPKEPEPYRKLIETYVAQEKYDDAVEIAQKAQKQVPETKKEEFKKLEQEYHSVIEYEWVVDPTIEADDIYYVRMDNVTQESENERRKQYLSDYAIIQQDGKLGLIDFDGVLRTGMDYAWIKSGYLMEKIDKTGLSYYDAFYDDQLHPDIITDAFDEKGKYIYYQGKLHNLAEWEGWNYQFQEPEQTIPVRNAEGSVNSSDPYSWWNSQKGKYGLYKDGEMITDFIYDECGSLSEGLLAVEQDGKWGYVDDKGNEIIPIQYDASWQQFETQTYVSMQDQSVKTTSFCYAASEGFVPLVKDNQWKLVNTEGKTVIPTGVFEAIRPVYDGKCWVKKDGKWGVIKVAQKKESDFETNIIGTWKGALSKTSDFIDDGEYSDICMVELKEDGTIVSQCHRSTDTGTYEVVGDNKVRATFDKNYYEAPGVDRMLVEGYSYTVLYTYSEQENVLYADYDDGFNQMGYQKDQNAVFTR